MWRGALLVMVAAALFATVLSGGTETASAQTPTAPTLVVTETAPDPIYGGNTFDITFNVTSTHTAPTGPNVRSYGVHVQMDWDRRLFQVRNPTRWEGESWDNFNKGLHNTGRRWYKVSAANSQRTMTLFTPDVERPLTRTMTVRAYESWLGWDTQRNRYGLLTGPVTTHKVEINVIPSNPRVEHTNVTVRYGDDRLRDTSWNVLKDTDRDGSEDRSMGPCEVNNTDCVLIYERYSSGGDAAGWHRVGGGRVKGRLDPDGVLDDQTNDPGWSTGQFRYNIALDDRPAPGKTFTVTPRVMRGDPNSVTFSPTSVTFTRDNTSETALAKSITVTPTTRMSSWSSRMT